MVWLKVIIEQRFEDWLARELARRLGRLSWGGLRIGNVVVLDFRGSINKLNEISMLVTALKASNVQFDAIQIDEKGVI